MKTILRRERIGINLTTRESVNRRGKRMVYRHDTGIVTFAAQTGRTPSGYYLAA